MPVFYVFRDFSRTYTKHAYVYADSSVLYIYFCIYIIVYNYYII